MEASGRRHFTPDDKTKIVLRLLRGEDPQALAAELEISVERLTRWERTFIAAGSRAFHQRRRSQIPALVWQWTALLAILVLTILALLYAVNHTFR